MQTPTCIKLDAALAGDARAQYKHGKFLYTQKSGINNIELAIDWLTRAAKQNYGKALYLLSVIFTVDLNNEKKACSYLVQAMEQKNPDSLAVYKRILDLAKQGDPVAADAFDSISYYYNMHIRSNLRSRVINR